MEEQKQALKNILPESLFNKGVFVAGGALTSIFTKKEINDIDVYFRNKESLQRTLDSLVADNYFIIFTSKKAVTLVKGEEKIQLIFYKYFNNTTSIFNDFDYSVNMAAYDCEIDTLVLSDNFLTTLASREIRFNPNTPYPIISLFRTKKYTEKGFTFSTNSLLKIGTSCSKLNITSWEELEDQLGGVYGELCLTKEEKNDFSLDYAMNNIKKIFKIKTETPDINKKRFEEITGLIYPIDDFSWIMNKGVVSPKVLF